MRLLIGAWHLYLDSDIVICSMVQIWALYLNFEGTKTINVLEVLIWGFGGCRMFLTGVWYLSLCLDMVTGLSYTHVPNFGSHLDFEGAKNIHVL